MAQHDISQHDTRSHGANETSTTREATSNPRDRGGISIRDLLDAEEAFGAPIPEQDDNATMEDVQATSSSSVLQIQSTWDPPSRELIQPDRALPDSTMASIFSRATTTLDDRATLESVRRIAGVPPPYEFPTRIAFAVPFRDLSRYTSPTLIDARDARYWEFMKLVDCERRDALDQVAAVSAAGYRFVNRRCGNGDQSPEAFFSDLRVLVDASFRLHDVCSGRPGELSEYFYDWRTDKMLFTMDCMVAVIEGEVACHGARPPTGYLHDQRELQQLRDRFDAVVERVVHWPRYIAAGNKLTGTLINNLGARPAILYIMRSALKRPGTPSMPRYRPGHTEYSVAPDSVEPAGYVDEIIAWLPRIKPPPAPEETDSPEQLSAEEQVASADQTASAEQAVSQNVAGSQDEAWLRMLPPADVIASDGQNCMLEKMTRGLVQQYIALRALLATAKSGDTSPWQMCAPFVQLNEYHNNYRGILIFKSAWLVIAMADKLWSQILKHEKKGHIRGEWAARKAKLQQRLETMTRVGIFTPMSAAREALRYREVKGDVKYWM